ncbi:hypothetical protein Gotur_019805, partial [Gossypium turneri]
MVPWRSSKESSLLGVQADLGEFGRTDRLRPHSLRDERSSPVTLAVKQALRNA